MTRRDYAARGLWVLCFVAFFPLLIPAMVITVFPFVLALDVAALMIGPALVLAGLSLVAGLIWPPAGQALGWPLTRAGHLLERCLDASDVWFDYSPLGLMFRLWDWLEDTL